MPTVVYILWSLDANSWNAVRQVKAIYQTLEGAIADVPDNIKKLEEKPSNERYLKNYRYLMIEEYTLLP